MLPPAAPAPAAAVDPRKGQHAAIETNKRVRIQVKRILGPPEHGTVVGHVVGFDGETYDIEIEHGEYFHLITFGLKRGETVSRTREDITLWEPQKASKTVGRKQAKKKPAAKAPASAPPPPPPAEDDDFELVGVQTPAERAAESRRRAEAEGNVLEIDDDDDEFAAAPVDA